MKVGFNRQVRKGLLAGGLLLALLLMATPAIADPPTIEPLEPEDRHFAAGEVCPFAVDIHDVTENGRFMTLVKDDGQEMHLITGTLVTQFTNADTGKSVTLNVSGTYHKVANPDGSGHARLTGRNAIWLFPEPLQGLSLIKGRLDWYDASGDVVIPETLTVNGTVTSICDMLAD